MTRTCPKCGAEKDVEAFALKSRADGSRCSWCKACTNELSEKRNRRLREELSNIVIAAKGVPCFDCTNSFPHWVMDFDHLDGSKKEQTIAHMVRDRRMTPERLKAEISKCQVVCANCHRERTYRRANGLSL